MLVYSKVMKQKLLRIASLQPAIFRGVIVSAFTLLASVGVVISPAIPDATLGFIGSLSALIAALWIHPAVTPNDKVVSYLPAPDTHPGIVMSGAAVPTASDATILYAARHVAGS